MKFGSFACAIFLSTCCFAFCSAALADPDELSEVEERALLAQTSIDKCLTPQALQLVNELGVRELIEKLQSLAEHDKHKHGNALSPESTTLRLELSEVVVTTMLQCQEVVAQIDLEIADANELKAAMGSKRDQAIKLNSYANLIANGLVSTVGNALQMPETLSEQPGESMETGASALSGALGYLALRQQNGIKLSSGIKPNMLAKIFKRPNDQSTEYPDSIWRYLNTAPPGSKDGKTRRQLLIKSWIDTGRLPDLSTDKGRTTMRVLAGTMPQTRLVTLDLLDDRTAMLSDVRATVSQIYKELLNLMLVVRAL